MNQKHYRTYYIAFYRNNSVGYRIVTTAHNPDTCNGLRSLIEKIEGSSGDTIVPLFWKRLEEAEVCYLCHLADNTENELTNCSYCPDCGRRIKMDKEVLLPPGKTIWWE